MPEQPHQLSPAELVQEALARAKWETYNREREEHLERLRAQWNKQTRSKKPPPEHGTRNRYARGCRCRPCRRASREYYQARKPKKIPNLTREVRDDQHGTLTGYTYGCRCEQCKQAKRDYHFSREPGHGTEYRYQQGCMCSACKRAATAARNRRRDKALPPLPVQEDEHGLEKTYTHKRCRCDLCREAHRVGMIDRRKARTEHYRAHPELIPATVHGTDNGYTYYQCRCERCTTAHSTYTTKRRQTARTGVQGSEES